MNDSPIAVVGLASLLPGSDDLAGFWEALVEARDCFTDVPEQHWRIEDYFDPRPRAKDKTYGKRGGFVPRQAFDALAFGLPPSSLPSTDVAQLLALLIAQRCLADADNGQVNRFDRQATSVILGCAATTQLVAHMSGRMSRPMWKQGLKNAGFDEATAERACEAIADQFIPWQESTFPGLLGNVIAGRIANRFDLGGTNCVLDAACASSLAALSMALGELRSGRMDTVITGGVDALNDILMFLCFSQTPALSMTGDCRPFSDQADGTMLGEGVAMLALRRLEDAERDGHKIYAVIRGLGTSSDGRAKSVYAPRAQGQALALRRAYKDAGYGPDTVGLVEAHGTGTVAGDAAEFGGLSEVFGEARPGTHQWCALGSVKSQIGHTKAAAGAASLVKAVLALRHRTVPPTIKVERPNPAMGLETSPFYLNTLARPWFAPAAHPRRAGVSSFGFGGSNFHVTLEEYQGANAALRLDASPVRLLLFSAADAADIRAQLAALPTTLTTAAEIAAHAAITQEAFSRTAHVRLAVVVEGPAQLADACAEADALLAKGIAAGHGKHCVLRTGAPRAADGVAFVFPGQGSQYVGMGRDLAVHVPEAHDAWQAAIDAMAQTGEAETLADVVFPRPVFTPEDLQAQDARLRATRWAQPALAAASLAHLALLGKAGLTPAAVTGHSFGELTALHAAGAFDAATLLRLARARGVAMEAAAGTGAGKAGSMLAVAGGAEAVRAVLAKSGVTDVVLANDNHPKQVVLSGTVDGLRRIEPALKGAGLSVQPLNVAAAFHSPLVSGAVTAFTDDVRAATMQAPRLPVIANTTAAAYGSDPVQLKSQLAAQLGEPVRFRESVEALYAQGCRVFVEVGAGRVLSGLIGQCLAGRDHDAIALDSAGRHGLRSWWAALGELATLGLPIDFAALRAPYAPPSAARPKGPAVVDIDGALVGKPYPPRAGTRPAAAARTAATAASAPVAVAASAVAVAAPAAAPSPSASPAAVPVSAPAPARARAAVAAPAVAPAAPAARALVPSTVTAQTPKERPRMSDRLSPSVPVAAVGLHAQILEAQRLTQQAILESFAMALRGFGSTAADLTPAALTVTPQALAPVARPMMMAAPAQVAMPAPLAVAPPAAAVAPPVAPPAPVVAAPAPVAPPAAVAAPVAVATPAPAAAPAEASPDLVLAIIADKTGYPLDALAPEMDLEADLGIDSIKRVEILAAVNEQVPSLDASKVSPADVRKISDLLRLMEGASPDPRQAAAR